MYGTVQNLVAEETPCNKLCVRVLVPTDHGPSALPGLRQAAEGQQQAQHSYTALQTAAQEQWLSRLNLSTEVDQLQKAAEAGTGLQGTTLAQGTVEFTDTDGERPPGCA